MKQDIGRSRIHLAQAGLLRLERQPMGLTSTLLGRKGLLRMLALPGLAVETAERLAAAYYSSPRFDVGRSLADVLAAAYDADPALSSALGGAIVVLDMDIYIVATPGVVAWIAGYESIQRAFDVTRRVGLPAELGKRPSYAVDWEIHVAHWRLTAGDVLVAVVGDMDDPLPDERVARLAGRHGSLQSLAEAVAKAVIRADRSEAGALVCAAGGFAPVPDSPGDTPAPTRISRPIEDNWAPRRGISPIWMALILAILAIMGAVQLTGPDATLAALNEYLQMAFGPDPTPTATPEPTATPGQPAVALLPAPRPATPGDGARLSEPNVTLTWSWSGRLAQGQTFEVRLARAGETLSSLRKTVEQQATFAPNRTGWYEWVVVVVSDQGGDLARQISELSAPISFFWSAD